MTGPPPNNDLPVIFLGAGKGSRLHPYTIDRPKWLLPVRGKPLLHYLVATAHRAGLTEVQLVSGVPVPDPGLPCIGIVENPNPLNMVDSLFRAEQHFGADFIMSYADILYEPRVFQFLLESTASVSVVIDRDWMEYYRFRSPAVHTIAESLELDGDRIIKIGEPLASTSRMPDGQYIGLVRFRDEGVRALTATYHEFRRTRSGRPWRHASQFEHAFMTDMLQELIDQGIDVRAVAIDRGWLEFDTREDYERVIAADRAGTLSCFIDLGVLPRRPTVLSAGGIVMRDGVDGLEVLLVTQGNPNEWRLPKGMQERAESIRATAEREVAEETGVLCKSREFVGSSEWTYRFGDRDWDEIARFYLMEETGSRCEISDAQIVSANWMRLPEAVRSLKYDGERELLQLGAAMRADSP